MQVKPTVFLALVAIAFSACGEASVATSTDESSSLIPAAKPVLLRLTDTNPFVRLGALERLDKEWQDEFAPAVLEFITLVREPALQGLALGLLRKHTRQDFGYDINAWFSWIWRQKFPLLDEYAEFKSDLYADIDPRFAGYFSAARKTRVRLDEIRWGGVLQDGIPPLREPRMLAAARADYLQDDNVVFGLEVNGDFRAYPKRILAWHEMFVDVVGGIPVAGVYCTLCGSMILYETTVDGQRHAMGTSGFLYRSNKLMYDQDTQSLWNTMWGEPVVGPLVGKNIRLPRRTVVTTTWGEWRRRHPETTVLSLDTGYRRDYGEGVAYRAYFATDELMFNSSELDNRLANKAEVLGLTTNNANEAPLAVSAKYAMKNPLIHERVGDLAVLIVTDDSGAMRAYESQGLRFKEWDGDTALTDANGKHWTLREDSLVSADGAQLARLPSHNAFWFGWYGAHTNTRLLR